MKTKLDPVKMITAWIADTRPETEIYYLYRQARRHVNMVRWCSDLGINHTPAEARAVGIDFGQKGGTA